MPVVERETNVVAHESRAGLAGSLRR
jgi:hypothetical protein